MEGLRRFRARHPVPPASGEVIPWSPAFELHRWKLIRATLADAGMMERFRTAERLPSGFGVGVDERCIEYPWLLAQLDEHPGALLDAGSTLNHALIFDQPALRRKNVHVVTFAPDGQCFWERGISYLFHDLRDLPMRDATYDCVVCLSTLEHVGCDNEGYTGDPAHRESRPDEFLRVIPELRRVLKTGGTLLFTVPFGVYRLFPTFQHFDRALLTRAVDAFGARRDVRETFYRYTAQGWGLATAAECAGCQYVEAYAPWIDRPQAPRPQPLPVEPDRAAAARAVACVRLVKG
jgi:SAM-dependent methyltransferase